VRVEEVRTVGRAWRTAVAGALLATVLAAPASAATKPSPPASASLQQRASQQAAELDAGRARQEAAAREATAALEAHQAAQRAAEAAVRHARQQATMLSAAEKRTAETRARLSRYVGSLYRTGMGNRQLAVYSGLMDASTPQQLFRGLGVVARVGGNQNDEFVGLARAEQAQERAARRAKSAADAARTATDNAAAAKRHADKVVADAVAAVAAATTALAKTQQALAIAQRREALMASAALIARQRSSIPLAAIEGALADRPVPECKGGEVHGYPNGRLPTSALCPLWGTSGALLRADAAASFDAMSKAFGAEFGEPICVTDSYRSYPEQVAVAIAKPTLAAVPGSSNHGWGVALDLCGGIQSFGTKQHKWMNANSMAYGWFLPAWAQASGSKPEAWHWEYAL
jgi:hypothetical protein